jgi:hypothetical protein
MMRAANGLYEFGRTLLVLKKSGAEIVNAPFEASLTDICGRPFQSAIIVDIADVIKTIDKTLTSIKDTK